MERPKAELFKLADKQIEENSDSSSSSRDRLIRAVTTRQRKKNSKVHCAPEVYKTESDSSVEERPRKRKNIEDLVSPILSRAKTNERIKNLASEEVMKRNIQITSSPRQNEERSEDKITEVPLLTRKRVRPTKMLERVLPPKLSQYKIMGLPYPEYSPTHDSSYFNFWNMETSGNKENPEHSATIIELQTENAEKKQAETRKSAHESLIDNTEKKCSSLLSSIFDEEKGLIKKEFRIKVQEKNIEGRSGLKILIIEEPKRNETQYIIPSIAKSTNLSEKQIVDLEISRQNNELYKSKSPEILSEITYRPSWAETVNYIGANNCAEAHKNFYCPVQIEPDGNMSYTYGILN